MKYKNKILYGDAQEMLADLPDGIARMCVTSPPYWGLRDYDVSGQIGLENSPQAYTKKLTAILNEVRRVLKKDGTLWLNLGDTYYSGNINTGRNDADRRNNWGEFNDGEYIHRHQEGRKAKKAVQNDIGLKPKDLTMIPARVAMALQSGGWYLRSDIIWHKPNPMPESVKDRPTKSHEHLFLLSKSKRYYYDWQAIGEEFTSSKYDQQRIRIKGDENYGKHAYLNGKSYISRGKRNWCRHGKKNKRDVWSIRTQSYPESHYAVYPPTLVAPCIKAGSTEGDVILDPFIGSGTTAEVALRLGRQYLGIDLQEDNKELIEKRLQSLKQDMFIHT
jgi:DNA modification methylase